MKRDTIKTVAGLIIIGGIVVATFLYGNSQRQAQLAHDQDVKKQQEEKAKAQAKAASPSTTPTTNAAATNTAPVKSPASNNVQGGGTPTPGAVASAATSPTPATVPTTGGSALPDTGPETMGALGLGSISMMLLAVRRSRQAMLKAARGQR